MINKTNTGKTFLRSTSHLVVRDTKGNRLRSFLVGFQFGIIHLPGELISVSLWPFVKNIAFAIYYLFSNAIFVLTSASQAILAGFEGYLEACEEIAEKEQDYDE